MNRITNHPYVVKVYDLIQNPYVITVIAVIVVLYGSLMAPRLPPNVARWFDYPFVKMLIIFMIVIIHRVNPMIALLLAVAFLLSIQTLTFYQSTEMKHFQSQPQMILHLRQQPSYEENH